MGEFLAHHLSFDRMAIDGAFGTTGDIGYFHRNRLYGECSVIRFESGTEERAYGSNNNLVPRCGHRGEDIHDVRGHVVIMFFSGVSFKFHHGTTFGSDGCHAVIVSVSFWGELPPVIGDSIDSDMVSHGSSPVGMIISLPPS